MNSRVCAGSLRELHRAPMSASGNETAAVEAAPYRKSRRVTASPCPGLLVPEPWSFLDLTARVRHALGSAFYSPTHGSAKGSRLPRSRRERRCFCWTVPHRHVALGYVRAPSLSREFMFGRISTLDNSGGDAHDAR